MHVKPLIHHSHVDSGPLQCVRAHESRRTSAHNEDIDLALFREWDWHVASASRGLGSECGGVRC